MGVRGLRSAEKSKIIQTCSVENCDSRGPQERLREEEATGKGLQRGDSEGKEDPDRLPVESLHGHLLANEAPRASSFPDPVKVT